MEHQTEFYELTFLSSTKNPYLCITKSTELSLKTCKTVEKAAIASEQFADMVEVPVSKKARERQMRFLGCNWSGIETDTVMTY